MAPNPTAVAPRVAAAVHALGGPKATMAKAPSKAPTKAPLRVWNKAAGRMETKAQMKAYRPPAAKGVSKAINRQAASKTPAHPAAKPYYLQNEKELFSTARNLVKPEVQAERLPFQERGKEIAATGKAAGERLAGYGNQTLGQFDALKGSAQGSAKTFENQIADNTLKTEREVETAGQNANTTNAGYLDPQVKAQQEAEKNNVQAIGSAAAGAAGNNVAAEQNFLTNMRAAAGLRVGEGQGKLAALYAGQAAQNQAGERATILRGEGRAAKLGSQLVEKAIGTRTALGKLGVLKEQTATKAAAAKSKIKAEGAKVAQGAQGLAIKAAANKINEEYKKASLEEKKRLDNANISDKEGKLKQLSRKNAIAEAKAGKPSKVSSAQKSAYEKELGVALNAFERGPRMEGKGGRLEGRDYQDIRNKLGSGVEATEVNGKEKLIKGASAKNAVIINAAEQLYRYHYVNAQTKAALKKLGLPSEGLSNLLMRR